MKIPFTIVFSRLPVDGLAIFPFIFVKHSEHLAHKQLIYHERIHFAQQLELLFVPFFLIYLFHYLWNLFRFRAHERAYREICFEKEAYENDSEQHYLKNRKRFAFLNYL